MDGQPKKTLEELARVLPKPSEDTLEALIDDDAREEFIATGAQIASERVLKDAERIYADAFDFWTGATEAQRAHLVGFSLELLGAGVRVALDLRAQSERVGERALRDATAREAQGVVAQKAFASGMARRDHAHTVLRHVAGTDLVLRTRVDAAVGTADDSEALATGLERLAGVAEEFLAHKKDKVAARVKLYRLTRAYVDGLREAAKTVRGAARAGALQATAKSAQSQLDLLDGINIHLLAQVIQAFEAAHELDSSIPRLVPISTRRLLGKRSARSGGGKGKGGDPKDGGEEPTG